MLFYIIQCHTCLIELPNLKVHYNGFCLEISGHFFKIVLHTCKEREYSILDNSNVQSTLHDHMTKDNSNVQSTLHDHMTKDNSQHYMIT